MGGRGRGAGISFTYEQMQSFGLLGKDSLHAVNNTPPPLYPQLLARPAKMEPCDSKESAATWKHNFLYMFRYTPFYRPLKPQRTNDDDVEVYADLAYVKKMADRKPWKPVFKWHHLPADLRPVSRKRKLASNSKANAKKSKAVNIADHLKKLEEKETKSGTSAAEKANTDSEDEDIDDGPAEEELDEDNDYGANYFDNGEGFNDDDDIDDGPVY